MKLKIYTILLVALLCAVSLTAGSAVAEPFGWSGEVDLYEGNFTVIPANNPNATYQVSSTTAIAALDTASKAGGFDYEVSDSWYASYGSFSITSIGGLVGGWPGDTWYFTINGEMANFGLGKNELNHGDVVTFYYGPYADIPNASNVVEISVFMPIYWKSEVCLEEGTFEVTPANNPNVTYMVNNTTAFGALEAAAKQGGFEYAVSDAWYESYGSFSLISIGHLEGGWPGDTWYYTINGEMANFGLSKNELQDGDTVIFYYGPYADTVNATSMIGIRANMCCQQQVPEFPTIALPVLAIIGMAFFFQRRKD